jgi:hypothetical protein
MAGPVEGIGFSLDFIQEKPCSLVCLIVFASSLALRHHVAVLQSAEPQFLFIVCLKKFSFH